MNVARPTDDCVFCAKIAAGDVDRRWPGVVCFEPLDPVTPGHMLVVPVVHVPDVAADPFWSGQAMHAAAELAAEVGDCNVITSRGAAATQTVFHLHVHIVPRAFGDRLALPWTGQLGAVVDKSGDWDRVLSDISEAAASGREPEDVQAERHARERRVTECRCVRSRWFWFWHAASGGSRCRSRRAGRDDESRGTA